VPDTGPLRPAQRRGPIFIVGAQGSGSTLLRLILDSHDHIAIPQETGFMRAYNAHQYIPFKWSGRSWAKRMGWSREELDRELAAFYDRIFSRYVEREGKQRWGDKTPFHTWHVDAMARLFPDAVFVAIVRHPGGNVASNMNRFGHPFRQAVSHVDRYNRELARQATRHADRFAFVRYEELVLHPEPLLRELLEWLGEPWSDRVLEHHAVQAARGGNLTAEGQNRKDDPIDVSRIDKWRHTLPAKRRPELASSLGRLGAFYGYAIDDPRTMEQLGADGALLVRGSDIEARISRFEDLDLLAEPVVPAGARFYRPGEVRLRLAEAPDAPVPVEPEPPMYVRLWKVLPYGIRRRLHPFARRLRRKLSR
jgi:hypothetical protein